MTQAEEFFTMIANKYKDDVFIVNEIVDGEKRLTLKFSKTFDTNLILKEIEDNKNVKSVTKTT
jgi:hypothetical protein